MPYMKSRGVGWLEKIPTDWNIIRMTKCFKFFKGLDIKKTDLVQCGSAVISYGQVHDKLNNGYSLQKNLIRYINQSMLETKEKSKLSNGDFVFADTSEDLDGVGNCIYIDLDGELYAGYHTLVARCIEPDVCHKYLAFLFLTEAWRSQLRRNANGTKVYSVTQRMFKFVSCLLPPIDIQLKIVSYLEQKCNDIDTIIVKEQSVIEKLQEYKQSVITEVVTKGLDPKVDMIESGINWIKTIPITWKVSKLKYVADFSPKCNFTEVEPDTEVTYTPMEYIKKGNYIPNSEAIGKLSASLTRYEEGDIVIAKVTPCFENGNIAIMNNLKSGKGLGSSELFVFRVPEAIRKFVYYWMQNKLFIEQCVATMTGTGGLKRVSSYYISNSEILLPPTEVIDDICKYLDEKCELIERTIHQKELVINKLTEYKQSLIYEVVTGKKEVPHV